MTVESFEEHTEGLRPDFCILPQIKSFKREVESADINWDLLVSEFSDSPTYNPYSSEERIQGIFGEFVVDKIVEGLVERHSDVEKNPIKDGDVTEHFRFRQSISEGSFNIQTANSADDLCEFDNLIVVNEEGQDVPAVIEAKFVYSTRLSNRRDMKRLLDDTKLSFLKRALCEYFQTDKMSYMFFVPNDRFEGNNDREKFVAKGIVPVELPFHFDEFLIRLLQLQHHKAA